MAGMSVYIRANTLLCFSLTCSLVEQARESDVMDGEEFSQQKVSVYIVGEREGIKPASQRYIRVQLSIASHISEQHGRES